MIPGGCQPGSELLYLAFPKAKHDEKRLGRAEPGSVSIPFGNLPAFEDSATAE
jgi:hypothetical protein